MSQHTLNLLRVSISQDARLDRTTFEARADTETMALVPERLGHHAYRVALSYRLLPWRNFQHGGADVRIDAAETKGRHYEVKITARETRRADVQYRHIYTLKDAGHGLIGEYGPAADDYDTLIDHGIGSATLGDFGRENLFYTDLRKTIERHLDGRVLKLWRGVWVALSAEDVEASLAIAEQVNPLDTGTATLRPVILDTGRANREVLAEELATETFTPAYAELATRAGKPGPNLERLEEELNTLAERQATAERMLGVQIPAYEAQSDAEAALEQAMEAAA